MNLPSEPPLSPQEAHASDWESDFEDHKLIGELAEGIVKTYFENCGFFMERFGVERLFPACLEHINEEREADPSCRTRIGFEEQQQFVRFLRYFPDFIAVRNEKNERGVREIFPVEVKFRTERRFDSQGMRKPLIAIRLSTESVRHYKAFWPSTLLVAVCYHSRTMLATRVRKLVQESDGRVPIRATWRRSWFFDLSRHDFRPLWDLRQGYFLREEGERSAAIVAEWADEVRRRSV